MTVCRCAISSLDSESFDGRFYAKRCLPLARRCGFGAVGFANAIAEQQSLFLSRASGSRCALTEAVVEAAGALPLTKRLDTDMPAMGGHRPSTLRGSQPKNDAEIHQTLHLRHTALAASAFASVGRKASRRSWTIWAGSPPQTSASIASILTVTMSRETAAGLRSKYRTGTAKGSAGTNSRGNQRSSKTSQGSSASAVMKPVLWSAADCSRRAGWPRHRVFQTVSSRSFST